MRACGQYRPGSRGGHGGHDAALPGWAAALSQTSAGGDAVVAPAALDHPEARLLARQGKKIVAIKRVREDTGLGLKEAKELVESWD